MFAGEFSVENNQSRTDSSNTTPLLSKTPPDSNTTWEIWGQTQGIFASGATLSALFLLWQKRNQSSSHTESNWHDYFQSFFAQSQNPSYQEFLQDVRLSSYNQKELAVATAIQAFESEHPEPLPPVMDEDISSFKALDAHYIRSDASYKEALAAQQQLNPYDYSGRFSAISNGVQQL